MIYTIDWLKKEAEEIQAAWDGTDAGVKEERAHAAKELEEKLQEVEELIEELGL